MVSAHAMACPVPPPPPATSSSRSIHASLYTDGASRGNPGHASCGGVIYLCKDKVSPTDAPTAPPVYSFSMLLGIITNNEAEYHGLLNGLKAAIELGITHLTAHVDSHLVCKQIQGAYAVRHPVMLHMHTQCKTLIAKLQHFHIIHVPRSNNADADKLCNDVLDTKEGTKVTRVIPFDETGLSPSQQEHQQQQHQQHQDDDMIDVDEKGNTDIPNITSQASIDVCWHELRDIIINTAHTHIGTVTTPPNSKEWWSYVPNIDQLYAAYRTARRKRRYVRRRGRSPPSILDLVTSQRDYVEAKSAFLKAVSEARKECWYELAAACDGITPHNKHKLLWSKRKRIWPSSRVPPASFCAADGSPPLTPTHALDNMASHLAAVSSPKYDPQHDAIHERHVEECISNDIPPCSNPSETPPFSLDHVTSACSSFRLNTALGSDNISPYFLRYGGPALHRALNSLYTIMSRNGVIPTQLKHGHIVTIYKGEGEVSDPNNYRPITITSLVARVYERLHVNVLLDAMQAAGMPSPEQFGFTRQRSTHDAIYRLLSRIVETIAKGTGDPDALCFSSTVFVDISKAYDKVWIDGLLYKLHKMGVRGNLFYMIRALITNRTIQVVSDGKVSQTHTLTAGVPQGSILAPFLFLIYIHDITLAGPNRIPHNVCMSLFADDIALLPLMPGTAGLTPLQSALHYMTEYANKWKITFSSKKTNVVFYRTGKVQVARYTRPQHTLTLSNFNIDTAPRYTYLGLIIDEFLTFIPHIVDLINKVNVTSSLISRLVRRDHLPSFPVIQTLVKCVLIPQMIYAFPFLPIIQDKPVSTYVATTRPTRGNLLMRLKNAILRPLLYSLGLPHNTYHESVLVESRLFTVTLMHALTSARLVLRWLKTDHNTHNEAASLFRQHITSPPTSSFHPYTRMQAVIEQVPLLWSAATGNPSGTSASDLKHIVWRHQYEMWSVGPSRSLPRRYPYHAQPLSYRITPRSLPAYLHYDDPATAAKRARFRFGRMQLRYDMFFLKFADITDTKCQQCDANDDETVDHVIGHCRAYDSYRVKCVSSLQSVLGKQYLSPGELIQTVISPTEFVIPLKLIPRVLKITGKFITQVSAIRKC